MKKSIKTAIAVVLTLCLLWLPLTTMAEAYYYNSPDGDYATTGDVSNVLALLPILLGGAMILTPFVIAGIVVLIVVCVKRNNRRRQQAQQPPQQPPQNPYQ